LIVSDIVIPYLKPPILLGTELALFPLGAVAALEGEPPFFSAVLLVSNLGLLSEGAIEILPVLKLLTVWLRFLGGPASLC
jgi:hypothetical protein